MADLLSMRPGNGRRGRIRIGYSPLEQQAEVDRYLAEHDINRVYVFAPARFPLHLHVPDGIHYEEVAYTDIIMYKTFYPLLEVIDPHTLLVFHACLRAQNRSDLTYNCAHHYANQTPHVLVLERFPFIEREQDFLILLDYQAPGRYKGQGFHADFVRDADVACRPWHLTATAQRLTPSAQEIAAYEREKERQFETLGTGDPDTIPRKLHIFAGKAKRGVIQPERRYVARNSRFGLPNVATYDDVLNGPLDALASDYLLLDFPHRRLDFNDFLTRTGQTTLRFIHSGLRVDDYYFGELERWIERLEAFYALCS